MFEIAGGILIVMIAIALLTWMMEDPGTFFGCLLFLILGAGALLAIAIAVLR